VIEADIPRVKELLDAAQDAMLKAHAAHVKRIHARGGHKSGRSVRHAPSVAHVPVKGDCMTAG
jgi:cellobiose-specific phosphotransferase system component IIA